MPQLTVKHVGGGSSFIRTTAAGGTGKTPPGTGCNPGAVVSKKTKTERVLEEEPEKKQRMYILLQPHTGEVAWLEGDHLVSVRFGVLRFTVHLIVYCRRGGRHNSLWKQRCQFDTRHVLKTQNKVSKKEKKE